MADSAQKPPLPKFQQRISRRAMICTGIAATAVTVPMRGTPLAADHPDAELLLAGAELDLLIERYEETGQELDKLYDANPHLTFAAFFSKRKYSEEELAALEMARVQADIDVADEACDKAGEEMDRQASRILKMKAATISGLAVKTKTIRIYAPDLWEKPMKDLDYDKELIRDLVEEVERLAGVAAT